MEEPIIYRIFPVSLDFGGSAKSRNRSFCVLRKSKTGNFSVVTLRVATLKIPGLVFFVIHQKFSTGTFGTAADFGFRKREYYIRMFLAAERGEKVESAYTKLFIRTGQTVPNLKTKS